MTASRDQVPLFHFDARTFLGGRRPTREERRALGVAARKAVPVAELARVPEASQRVDTLSILRAQDASREQSLVPLRYERMAVSAFTFLRGSAAVMAHDLSLVSSSGVRVQLCGDAHVANFGMFASAERTLVFDINDFDETLPGSFDWDVRRLAASAAVGVLDQGGSKKKARKAAKAAATAYRTVMAALSQMPTLDVWNLKVNADYLMGRFERGDFRKATQRAIDKSERSTSATAASKLTERVNGHQRFRNDPPLLVRLSEEDHGMWIDRIAPAYDQYLKTLPPDRVALLSHYSFVDMAHKVVGVGSVGTRAFVMLLESGDGEPLVLQITQAMESVLEKYQGKSEFDNHGERVVVGQRVMQTTGDPLLGWVSSSGAESLDFYVRQLKDLKGSIDMTRLDADGFVDYARVCGATMARSHARVGDSSMVTGYLGEDDSFDEAIADFAMGYVKITDLDHRALLAWLATDDKTQERP